MCSVISVGMFVRFSDFRCPRCPRCPMCQPRVPIFQPPRLTIHEHKSLIHFKFVFGSTPAVRSIIQWPWHSIHGAKTWLMTFLKKGDFLYCFPQTFFSFVNVQTFRVFPEVNRYPIPPTRVEDTFCYGQIDGRGTGWARDWHTPLMAGFIDAQSTSLVSAEWHFGQKTVVGVYLFINLFLSWHACFGWKVEVATNSFNGTTI